MDIISSLSYLEDIEAPSRHQKPELIIDRIMTLMMMMIMIMIMIMTLVLMMMMVQMMMLDMTQNRLMVAFDSKKGPLKVVKWC